LFAEKRRSLILEMLKHREDITSREIAKKLNASTSTIWRDLNFLSAKGKVLKTHGGAMTGNFIDDFEFLFSTRLKKNVELKRKIAAKAASLVESGDVIAIDTGTTASLLASCLKSRTNISVVTASLGAAQELLRAKGVYTVLIGGDLKEESMSTVGTMALQHIRRLRVHKYFIGAAALDPLRGSQDAYLFEMDIKKELVSIAKERIIIADGSKFGKTSLAISVNLKDIDMVITDKTAPEDHLKLLRQSGIRVILI
jgi:DeoR family fructose operon transcriptional repressor